MIQGANFLNILTFSRNKMKYVYIKNENKSGLNNSFFWSVIREMMTELLSLIVLLLSRQLNECKKNELSDRPILMVVSVQRNFSNFFSTNKKIVKNFVLNR